MTLRVLLVTPEAVGVPRLGWVDELSAIACVDGVELAVCGGLQATRAAVAARLRAEWDLILWSGHGAPGRLLLVDGPVGADWLACMMRQQPPGVAVLSACFSGARDEALHSIAETLSQSSVTCVGMWVGVEDRAAVVYDVEFVRAYATGGSVAVAHRVAVAQVAMEYPSQAGAAFLLPGLVNGYGKIAAELGEIRRRLDLVESKIDGILRTI